MQRRFFKTKTTKVNKKRNAPWSTGTLAPNGNVKTRVKGWSCRWETKFKTNILKFLWGVENKVLGKQCWVVCTSVCCARGSLLSGEVNIQLGLQFGKPKGLQTLPSQSSLKLTTQQVQFEWLVEDSGMSRGLQPLFSNPWSFGDKVFDCSLIEKVCSVVWLGLLFWFALGWQGEFAFVFSLRKKKKHLCFEEWWGKQPLARWFPREFRHRDLIYI